MERVCYCCKKTYGHKPPHDNPDKSHGLCETCMPLELDRVRREIAALKKEGKIPWNVEIDIL